MANSAFTISFDLDNTLWDVDQIIIRAEQSMRDWMREHTPDAYVAYTPEVIQPIRERVMRKHAHAATDLSFLRTELLYELMRQTGYGHAEARAQAKRAFEVFFEGRNTIEFFPGALDAIRTLAEDYRLLALTNGNADIHRAGLGEFFSGAVNSAEAGAKKPDPKIYQHFMDKYSLRGDQVIHVGDNLVDDVQGASDAGMRTVWVNLEGSSREAHHQEPHEEITDLSQLVKTIAKLTE